VHRPFAVLALLAAAATSVNAAELLDNDAVIRLTKAGLTVEIVLLKIEQSDARFDVSTDALIALKSAGVSDAVIKAMMMKAQAPPPRAAAPAEAAGTTNSSCVNLSLYTLGTNGWDWVPATACLSSTDFSVDEQ